MSLRNNDPFISGAAASSSPGDFLRVQDVDIDRDIAFDATKTVINDQTDRIPIHLRSNFSEQRERRTSPIRAFNPVAVQNEYTTAINNSSNQTASAPPAMNYQDDTQDITGDQIAQTIMNSLTIQDSSLTPKPFTGASVELESTEKWLHYFNLFCEFRQIRGKPKLQLFCMLMTGDAQEWLRSQSDQVRENFDNLLAAFRTRYTLSDIDRWKTATKLLSKEQSDTESVASYITAVRNAAKIIPITDNTLLRYMIIKGLRPQIRLHVLQTGASDLESVIKAAEVAEAALLASTSAETTQLSAQINKLLSKLETPSIPVPPVIVPTPTVAAVEIPKEPHRVRFEQHTRQGSPSPGRRQERRSDNLPSFNNEQFRPNRRDNYFRENRQDQQRRWNSSSSSVPPQRQRSWGNQNINYVPKQSYFCNNFGHIQRFCRAASGMQRPMNNSNQYVGPNYYHTSHPQTPPSRNYYQ